MNRAYPPLPALRAFEAVARRGSMVAAAAELGVTPGAVSQQVKSLESILGLALFDRRPQSLEVTQIGAAYAAELGAALDLIAGATARLRPPPARRLLTLALPSVFAAGWLLPHLARFERAHPAIELQLRTGAAAEPEIETVDAAIRLGRAGWPVKICRHLFGDVRVPVRSPAGRLRDGAESVALIGTEPAVWAEWAAATGLAPPPRFLTLGDETLAIQAALNGLGVALPDRHLVEAHLADGQLMSAYDGAALVRGTAWYLVAQAGSPDIDALTAWMYEVIDEGPAP